MGTLNVDYISDRLRTFEIPTSTLKSRIVQYYEAIYTGGEFNPDNTYRWIPGAFYDFTPARGDTRIRYKMRLPMAWSNSSHAITNLSFFVDTTEYYNFSVGMTYYENSHDFDFEVPSWGTTAKRIGLQTRSHSNDGNEIRYYTTYYWDGTGRNAQNARGQLFIEEYYY